MGSYEIEVVQEFVYLGVTFNFNNSFNKAADKQLFQAKKALFFLNSKTAQLNLPVDLQLNLFEKLIIPVLTYGCEIWGFTNLSRIELFQRKFLKRALNVHKYIANVMAYGETGLAHVENKIYVQMITYWHRIRTADESKLAKRVFQLMKYLFDTHLFQSTWCIKINSILNNTGLSYLWNYDGVNQTQLKASVKIRINDIFIQNWLSEINRNNICTNYRIYKNQFQLEPYLSILDKDLQIIMSRYRTGAHNLPITDRRYNGIGLQHICPLCFHDVGDEFHYLFVCPALHQYRKIYLERYFYHRPNAIKYQELFSSNYKIQLVKLTKFIKIIIYVFRN